MLPRLLPRLKAASALSAFAAVLLAPAGAFAQIDKILGGDVMEGRPVLLLAALGSMALVPILLTMVTSFVKIIVVLSILRQGLGTNQSPPTMVLTAIAFMMSFFIMSPVMYDAYYAAQDRMLARGLRELDLKKLEPVLVTELVEVTQAPLRKFLRENSDPVERKFFLDVSKRIREGRDATEFTEDDYSILTPAFVMSELKDAFIIGFILYMPFLVLDMVIGNILMALGMQMLSPNTISLPFKILMFVAADGWALVAKGLSLSYL